MLTKLYYTSLGLLLSIGLFAQDVSTLVVQRGSHFEGITWSPDGRIYAVDFFSGFVYKMNSLGDIQSIGRINGALGGAMDKEGNFYCSEFNTGKIIKFTPDDQMEVYASGLVGPAGILIDDDSQTMYVANYSGNNISKIDMGSSNPRPIPFASSSLFNGPDGLVFSPEGDIISANFEDNSIQKITPNGEVTRFTTLAGSTKSGYIVRNDDSYFITGANGSSKIYEISFDGQVKTMAGTSAKGYKDGPARDAQFDFPNGIALSPTGDTLIVTESTAEGRIRMITGLQQTTSNREIIKLHQLSISPNPTSSQVDIRFDLSENALVQIELLDSRGVLVDSIMSEKRNAGMVQIQHRLREGTPAGAYLIHIKVNDQVSSRPLILK